jgi:hypothetical protein
MAHEHHDHHDHEHHHHEHEHEDGTYGMALGFRTVEEGGKIYLAEAEIAPYVDEPGELGVTLVFHPLDGVDPTATDEEIDWPAWPIDIDDDLTRNPGDSPAAQFQSIVRQLHGLTAEQLREYLGAAREEE